MTMSSFSTLEAECLHQFGVAPRNIGHYSWGSACLAHLYRGLCRASRYNCKEIDGPITLLLGWAWIRLPYLSPLPSEPHSFPLANRWHNWERGDRRYRYLNLAHFRKAFDELQEGQFVWVAYAVDRVDPNIILAEIYMQSVVWSATVSLCHLNVSSGMLPIGIGDSSVSFREYLSRSRIWTRRMEKS
ncbi:hypothetical protein Ahy_B05g078410 isoform B [Arachis hypogaea]|uniref:Aminotransferase-like plant mobile domain-containing protein n=1 Tax=Arachis hypogaea TaxID=3818 RepID=A0A444Z703_ARAHY|nr:hypothetical protein Ahy_B05g078410 isoform B [Arachis hypogaea]